VILKQRPGDEVASAVAAKKHQLGQQRRNRAPLVRAAAVIRHSLVKWPTTAPSRSIQHLKEQFIPAGSELEGFRGYFALDAGPRLFASVTMFEDRHGAEASNRLTADFVHQKTHRRIPVLTGSHGRRRRRAHSLTLGWAS
jgi:hypothetical protein